MGDSLSALQRAFHETAPGRRVLTCEMCPIKRSGDEAQMIEHVTRLHVRIAALREGVVDPIVEPASPERAAGRGAFISNFLRKCELDCRRFPFLEVGGKIMASYQTNLLYETNQMTRSRVKTLGASEILQSYNEVPTVCLICGEGVKMIAAEKAATVCQCSRRKIYRWIEQGDLHYFEMPDGEVLVCGRSLSQKMDELDSRTDRFSESKSPATR